jgi:hypothetical protein
MHSHDRSGFNAVFRITDLPSLVSASNIMYFDPHCVVRPSRPSRTRTPSFRSTTRLHCSWPLCSDARGQSHLSRALQSSRQVEVSAPPAFGLVHGADYRTRVRVCPVQNLPGVSSAAPGKRIDFAAFPVLQQFPDQFEPYRLFGCTMEVRVHTRRSIHALHRRLPLSISQSKHRSPGLGRRRRPAVWPMIGLHSTTTAA